MCRRWMLCWPQHPAMLGVSVLCCAVLCVILFLAQTYSIQILIELDHELNIFFVTVHQVVRKKMRLLQQGLLLCQHNHLCRKKSSLPQQLSPLCRHNNSAAW